MSFILTDENLNTYTLPANFKVGNMGWKKKVRQIPIAFRDGGDEIGDKMLDTRIITLEGIISDNSTYATTIATLYSWLYKCNMKLSLTTGKYINVKTISDVTNDFFEGGFGRVSKIKFNCICPDPFFYSTSLISNVYAIGASPYNFTITNASLFDVLPTIEIINAANNHDLTIENTTDNANYFRFIDAGFDNTEILYIDNNPGTVDENGVNTIQNMTGNFLRLLPGANALIYTGANCSLTVEYYDKEL